MCNISTNEMALLKMPRQNNSLNYGKVLRLNPTLQFHHNSDYICYKHLLKKTLVIILSKGDEEHRIDWAKTRI